MPSTTLSIRTLLIQCVTPSAPKRVQKHCASGQEQPACQQEEREEEQSIKYKHYFSLPLEASHRQKLLNLSQLKPTLYELCVNMDFILN